MQTADLVKAGRTHLMDATPVTLGQELGGYASQVRRGTERLEAALPRLAEVPLGGTAVGTGINTPDGFAARVVELLAERTGLPVTEARDHFEAQGARDALVETSGALRTVAVSLTKICNDLRWMGSGPTAGLAEIRLPDLQPGSSIMPGKVNPVVPEAVLQVCSQVVGNDAAVAWAGASGAFELNVQVPVMARNLLESVSLLANASRLLADRCVDGLEPDAERMRRYAGSSPSVVTPLNRLIGYEAAAKIAKHAVAEGVTVREATIALGHVERGDLTEEQLDAALDVDAMTGRGPSRRDRTTSTRWSPASRRGGPACLPRTAVGPVAQRPRRRAQRLRRGRRARRAGTAERERVVHRRRAGAAAVRGAGRRRPRPAARVDGGLSRGRLSTSCGCGCATRPSRGCRSGRRCSSGPT